MPQGSANHIRGWLASFPCSSTVLTVLSLVASPDTVSAGAFWNSPWMWLLLIMSLSSGGRFEGNIKFQSKAVENPNLQGMHCCSPELTLHSNSTEDKRQYLLSFYIKLSVRQLPTVLIFTVALELKFSVSSVLASGFVVIIGFLSFFSFGRRDLSTTMRLWILVFEVGTSSVKASVRVETHWVLVRTIHTGKHRFAVE